MKIATATYLVILGGAILWCLAIVLPPVLLPAGGGWVVVGATLYQPFHMICHQLIDRSFTISGQPLAVCIRCTAIYFGFLLGTILYLPMAWLGRSLCNNRVVLLSSVVPMVVDVMLDVAGIHISTSGTRAISGALFGIVIPFYVIPTAQAAVQELLAASRFFTPSDTKKGSLHA